MFCVLVKKVGEVVVVLSQGLFMRLLTVITCLLLFVSITVARGWASTDQTIFGPDKFERLQGQSTDYAASFPRCAGSDQALIRIENGDGKKTRIKSGVVIINGQTVFREKDFKQNVAVLKAMIQVQDVNELLVVLKSGHHDDEEKLDEYLLEKKILERELAKLIRLQENQGGGDGEGSDLDDDDHDRNDDDHDRNDDDHDRNDDVHVRDDDVRDDKRNNNDDDDPDTDRNEKESVKNSSDHNKDDLQKEIETLKEELAELERKIARIEEREASFLWLVS